MDRSPQMDRHQEPTDPEAAAAEMREDDLSLRDETWVAEETNEHSPPEAADGDTEPPVNPGSRPDPAGG